MSISQLEITPEIAEYLTGAAKSEHPALVGLREVTSQHEHAEMQSAPNQMSLIAWLLVVTGARQVLEIGCFTGYGSLAMALAIPNGHVTTLDVNDQWAEIGRKFWREAGVETQIEFIAGLAAESLSDLQNSGRKFDFVYIDADKKSYPEYLETALDLLSPNGMIALDNMLWGGAVADHTDQTKQVRALRQVTFRIRDDSSLTSSLVPIGDGLMLVSKRR